MNWRTIKPFISYQWPRHRVKALGVLVVGGVMWGATAPEAYSPTHYVLRWKNRGMCAVVRERPDQRRKYAIIWFTTLKRVAIRKARELKEIGKCRRVPKPRR